MVFHLIVSLILNKLRFDAWMLERKELIVHVFDASTFAVSLVLLVGFMDPTVLALLGSTKQFQLIAGFAGCAYSIKAMFPQKP